MTLATSRLVDGTHEVKSLAKQSISREDRIKGAILGQFVGDALCLGSHWIYDFSKRDEVYPDGIRGFEEPAEGHYHAGRIPGEFTHYGDAGLVMLRSVAEDGRFDAKLFGKRFAEYFDESSYGGYRDKATKASLQTYIDSGKAEDFTFQEGSEDVQSGGLARLAPVVARHADDSNFDEIIEAATRVTQGAPITLGFARLYAHTLRALFAGKSLSAAIKAGVKAADMAEINELYGGIQTKNYLSIDEMTGEVGRACNLVSTMPAVIHAALHDGHSVSSALLETARAGGDNASRASILGAWLGANHGIGGLPVAWKFRVKAAKEIETLSDKLISSLG